MSSPDPRPQGLAFFIALALCWSAAAAAQDPAAARLFGEAKRLASAGDAAGALAEYQLLVQQFPSDSRAPEALLESARLDRVLEDDRSAKLAIERVLAEYPRSLEAASAFVLQGEMSTDQARSPEQLHEALTSFRRVPLLFGRDAFPGLEARARALLRHGEVSLLLGDRESALADFVALAEDEPASTFVWRGRLLLGRTLLENGESPAALETLQRLADDDEASEDSRLAARRLLSLGHRLIVRPQSGQQPWQRAERYAPSNLELREPIGVAASRDDWLLVLDGGADKIVRINQADDLWQSQSLRDGVRPGWFDDVPYVVSKEQLVLPFEGRRINFLEPKTGRERPLDNLRAAVRGPFGDWFLLAKGFRGLLDFQTPRRGQELLAELRPDFQDLECDALGRVYALDKHDKRVLRLAVDRRGQETVVTGDWRRPEALALDTLGDLYVLDTSEKQVHVYGPDGRRKAVIGPQLPSGLELRKPRDIAVDGSGRLWIADADLPFLVGLQ